MIIKLASPIKWLFLGGLAFSLVACQSMQASQTVSDKPIGNAQQPLFAMDPYHSMDSSTDELTHVYAKAADITLQQHSNQCQPLILHVGQTLAVQLPGNPSTGYIWQLDERPNNLQLLTTPRLEQQKTDKANLFGAPVIFDWRFKAMAPDKGELRLIYQRPWEENTQKANSFVCTIDIRQ